MTTLRRLFFAASCDGLAAYGISFDDLLIHLWQVRRHANGPLALREIRHLGDLVLAIACLRGSHRAWAEMTLRCEPALVRQASLRNTAWQALVHARRILADVQRTALCQDHDAALPTLRGYAGQRSLRTWLGMHLGRRLGAVAVVLAPSQRPAKRSSRSRSRQRPAFVAGRFRPSRAPLRLTGSQA